MSATRTRKFFLLPPTHFQIEYSINPWMDLNNRVDPQAAQEQWQALVDVYEDLGMQVEVLEPGPGMPDQVFPGDSIFLYGDQAIASRFREPERAAEVDPMVARFEQRGYTVHRLPRGMHFEGNGEAVKWNSHILAGYGRRSDYAALDFVAETLEVEVVPLEVQYPHFHVDTIVCPLDDGTIAFVPSGLKPADVRRLEALDAELIAVDEVEGRRLACNSMAIGETVVMSTDQAPHFCAALEQKGFRPLELDLSEFAKSGGGAKCLTLEAYQPNGA